MGLWFSPHTHGQHSSIDGMSKVSHLVEKAAWLEQPALVLTDHGNMGGTVDLYKSAKQHGILPFPGVEIYLADPEHEGELTDKVKRYHLGLFALDLTGYRSLVQFVSQTHTRPRFSRYPRALLSDLFQLGDEAGKHLVLTTGCYFGLVQQRLVNEGPEEAGRIIKAYASRFPNTYVEIQHHNIDHSTTEAQSNYTDTQLVTELVDLADELGLPILATQDTHYLDQKDKPAHALMKRMVYGGADDEFPGDSFHLASEDWVAEHYDFDPTIWPAVLDSCEEIVSKHALAIPQLDTFKVHMPDMGKLAMERLRKLTLGKLLKMVQPMKLNQGQKYLDRLNEELDVIEHVKMPEYFLHWDEFVRWCKSEKICIEARGSANGSLVLYLLGVTQVDPIKWGTYFSRFLSRDRVKPPDVDMDIQDDRRGEALAWLAKRFITMRIGTWSKMGVTVDEETGQERGSVLVTYQSYLRRKCMEDAKEYLYRKHKQSGQKEPTKAACEDMGHAFFQKRYGHVKELEDVRKISLRDYSALMKIHKMNSVYKSYGQHAGGVLLGPHTFDIRELFPTMMVGSSDAIVTQFDMDAVETWGVLKDDILGQASLSVMRMCQELIGRPDPNDFTWIPDDDREACKILRSGRTNNGVFHFEGYTKARGGREMGIRSTRDAVIASALYMPGCVQSGQKDRYIATRRNTNAKRREIELAKAQHPLVAEVLAETNGVMVYQEHPLEILRRIGMSEESVNASFKILKDSGKGAIERNRDRLDKLKAEYDKHCAEKGVTDPERLWQALSGFMAYGFNKNHSTGYGIRSYRTAYLKAHYPLEFMTALLSIWAARPKQKVDKIPLYVSEARAMGLRVIPPDINVSGASWTIDRQRKAIRRGLLSIKGIGPVVAPRIAAHAPYKDLNDVIQKIGGKFGQDEWRKHKRLTGVVKLLKESGAMESIGVMP